MAGEINPEQAARQLAQIINSQIVKTWDNVEKIVPNQHFFTSIVTTYTGTDPVVRVLVPVGVSY